MLAVSVYPKYKAAKSRKQRMHADRFIEDLMNDTRHPVHNHAHPLHKESVQALDEMMRRLDAMRNKWLP